MGSATGSVSDRVASPRDIAGWLWRGVIAVLFVSIGLAKFQDAEWTRIFARIGLGDWFRVATGVIEIAGAVLYLFPQTLRIGAVLLACTMLGAIAAHLTRLGDPIAVIIPGALLVAVVIIALRDPMPDMQQLMRRR